MLSLLLALTAILQLTVAQGGCQGNCTTAAEVPGCKPSCLVSLPHVSVLFWTTNTAPPASTSDVVAATWIYYADPHSNQTTASMLVENKTLPGYTPNSGTPTPTAATVTLFEGGKTVITTITYPTVFTAPYNPTYSWDGVLPTESKCSTNADFSDVPLPSSFSFPAETGSSNPSDTLGTMHMPTWSIVTPPEATWANLYPGEAAFQLCSTGTPSASSAVVATTAPPATAKTSVRFLTVSAVTQGPAPPGALLANAVQQQAGNLSKTQSSSKSQPTVPSSSKGGSTVAPVPVLQSSSPAAVPAPGNTSAVVFSNQTIALGQTETTNGETVVATTQAGGSTALIVAGSAGTSTVPVPPAQFTGAAVTRGIEYVLGVAAGVVGLLAV